MIESFFEENEAMASFKKFQQSCFFLFGYLFAVVIFFIRIKLSGHGKVLNKVNYKIKRNYN